jgi:tetratricopeptide (TPR) repeat protein
LAAVAVFLVLVVLAARARWDTADVEMGPAVASVEHGLEQRHRSRALDALRRACQQHDCACAHVTAKNGLDVDLGNDVLRLLNAMNACPGQDLDGIRAEALVRSGDRGAGLKSAELALQTRPQDAFALQARALSSYQAGELPKAAEDALAAVRAGRGHAAEMLVGLVAYHRDEHATAHDAFASVLKTEPDDTEATYNLALVAQRQGSYGVARSNYLKLTRLDPRNQDARHNLALLAHSVGALEEAQHHARKFLELNPAPARAASLAAALERPPEKPPAHVLKLGAAPAANSAQAGARPAP